MKSMIVDLVAGEAEDHVT